MRFTRQPPRARPLKHSNFENLFGIFLGVLVTSCGIVILRSAELVTGGTAGLGLLLSYLLGWSVGPTFVAVSAPFLLVALFVKGWMFTLRTTATVVALGAAIWLTEHYAGHFTLALPYAALLGNVLAGIGLLFTFRHGSSLGGFSTLAVIAQEKLGWRAGNVQLALDATVVLAAIFVTDPAIVGISLLGAIMLNIILTVNHRPDRYIAD